MQLHDYQFGHDVGVGVDDVSGALKGDAVVRTAPEEVTGAGGQNVVFAMEQIESTEELTDALSASAEVNGRYGLFRASAKFDFARSTATNSYSLFLLVSVSVTNSFRQMRDVQLTAAAADLWRSGNADQFRDRFGDGYVHGLLTGGLYHGVLQIDTESEEEKEEISSELEAGYGGLTGSFNAKAQFGKLVAKVSSKKSIKVRHLQIGGADSSVEVEADEMVQKATEFPTTVAGDRASPFSVLVKEYETVSNLPPQPNKHDLLLAKDVVRECGRLRLRYIDWINDLEYILARPGQFDWDNERKQSRQLGAKLDELREAITGLARRASTCANNLAHCEMPTGEDTVILEPEDIPERKRRKGSGTKSGGRRKRRYPYYAPQPVPGTRWTPVPRRGKPPLYLILGPARKRKRLVVQSDGATTKAKVKTGKRRRSAGEDAARAATRTSPGRPGR